MSVDLSQFIDGERSEVLNTTAKFQQLLGRNGHVESETDAEILIHVYFKQQVAINEIVIYADDGQNRPRNVMVYAQSLSFDQCRDQKPNVQATCSYKLGAASIKVAPGQLRQVGEMTVFIPSNVRGDDVTEFSGIGLFGAPAQSLNTCGKSLNCGG